MIEISPREHQVVTGPFADGVINWIMASLGYQGRLFVYRHLGTGKFVLAEWLNTTMAREFAILNNWPHLTNEDRDDLARKFKPNKLILDKEERVLRSYLAKGTEAKTENGRKLRRMWREAGLKNKHNQHRNDNPLHDPPRVSTD